MRHCETYYLHKPAKKKANDIPSIEGSQDFRVLRIVISHEIAIFDSKTLLPKGQMTNQGGFST